VIVRGTVLSDKRVPLDGAQPERPSFPPIRAVSLPPVSREPAPASEPPTPAPVVVTVPAPMSLDTVSKWIATQDETTRAALATQLAENIEHVKRNAHEVGRKAGLAEAEMETSRLLETLATINEGAKASLDAQSGMLAEQCAEIVATALTRIAGPLLATPEAALGAVFEVLKRLTEEREIVIRVGAADLHMLLAAEDRLAAALAGRKYSIVSDTRVLSGGAIVETANGSLDGRLDAQLRALCDTVIAARQAYRAPQ